MTIRTALAGWLSAMLWFGLNVRGADLTNTPPAAGRTNVQRFIHPLPPSQVVITHHPKAISDFRPHQPTVDAMMQAGLLKLTGKGDLKSAWLSLVSPGDVVGIKVYALPGAVGGTRPEVVVAVIRGLLAAGLRGTNLIIWDKTETCLAAAGYLDLAGQLGVKALGATEVGYDSEAFYDRALIGELVHGDLEFGSSGEKIGRKSFVSTLVSRRITRLICITPMLNHNTLGVTGHLYSLALGAVDNTLRFEGRFDHLDEAIPDITAMTQVADRQETSRLALCITDALLSQYLGERQCLLHYSSMLGELRFSTDPVALDQLSLRDLDRQRAAAGVPLPVKRGPKSELLSNAELIQLGNADLKRIHVERISLP